MSKKIITKYHTQWTCCRMYRIQAYCYFHSFRKVDCISVCHINPKTFFQCRTSVGKTVFNYQILRFFCIYERCNISFFAGDHRLHIFYSKFFQIICNLFAWTRCNLVDHCPWESDHFFITYIVDKIIFYKSFLLPFLCHSQH